MIKRLISPLSFLRKKNFQLSVKLLTLLFLAITCVAFAWHSYLGYSIIPKYKKILWDITTKRVNEINDFLSAQERNAINLSKKPILITALYDAYTKQQPTESHKEKIADFISPYKEQMFFKNILLIDSGGTIIFSTTKNNIIGENITKNSHANSALTTSYERASMSLTNDFSYFSFDELLQEPALFLTIPIIKNNKFIGALAYQLNEEKIYLITNQYIGLGKTGEVVLGKRDESSIVFTSPTRHDPDLAFKKRSISKETPLSIQPGILAEDGTGQAIDYRGKKVIAAWTFITKIDWAIDVKIDQEEILQPMKNSYKFLLIFLIIFLLLFCMTLYTSRVFIKKTFNKSDFNKKLRALPAILRNPFFVGLLIFLGFTIKNIVQEEMLRSSMINDAKNQAVKDISKNANDIEIILSKIAFVGQSIAKDLQTGHLLHDDITTRLKRDAKEYSSIIGITTLFMPYAYDKTIQLYAPSVTEIGDIYQEKLIKETSINGDQETSIFKRAWYTQAMEHGSAWLLNSTSDNNETERSTATYSCKFFDKNDQPQGVILITYSLADIVRIAEYSDFGQTGYSIILSDNGTFVFHPIQNIVQKQTTLLQFAQAKGNEELAVIAETIDQGKPMLKTYSSETNHETFIICTQPIPINNWTIGAIFSEDEIGLPAQIIRHYYFWILIWLLIAFCSFCAFLCSCNILTTTQGVIVANIILILSLISSWYIIQITTTINRESKTIITDQSSLNKFLNDLNEEAHRKHEKPPITIPFGIYLYSLDFFGRDNINISGYIWNKYNTTLHKDISHTIEMPQATKMQFGTPVNAITDDWETVTLSLKGSLFQNHDYARYPFDQQQIRIIFEHRDIEKNIILTPDLAGYKKISPEATPGLNKEFSLSGFNIQQTFFEYHKIELAANFGFKDYGKVTDHFQLIYNVIMNRNLLSPFVLFLLPLLVILFSLFCTLLMTKKDTNPFSVLAPYTGLFFALVILQRALRESHPTGSTLYMEYAFFFTYVTIILLIIHTILTHYYKHWSYYQEKALHTIKLLFWPFQLISWIITTLIIFY